ncbi:thiopeptide-type bacteriocin biosynthesis protein [Streptomyces sp. NPDC021020]|uniref:thiopeptide-type bacteriocin biosynthesis protein n=1 Tax=Streptomyces sp. NPDC021020 TaxID=3365109 RepID=UPI0037A1BA80
MSPDRLTRPERGPNARAGFAVASRDPLAEKPSGVGDEGQASWWHAYLHFADWTEADSTFIEHVLPLLLAAEAGDAIDGWWYTRKYPCWRLRLREQHRFAALPYVRAGLDRLVDEGHLHRWWPGIYEPETPAFGGAAGMSAAHGLFVADSREIQRLSQHGTLALGRRELSVLLCTILMRAAGLEWYEQGDVWHRVITADHRSSLTDVPPEVLDARTAEIRSLLLADTAALLTHAGPLRPVTAWAAAFRDTGLSLAQSVQQGTLERGLREVLSYHVLFHWNRLGLSLRAQSALAWSARAAILGPIAS